MAPPKRVVVVYGGVSAEHDISCISARFVVAMLDATKYDVVPVGITRTGRWVDAHTLVSRIELSDPDAALPSPDTAEEGAQLSASAADVGSSLPSHVLGTAADTVVFPLVHGAMGEDGTLQGMLEIAGVPYVGAGVLASAVAMDKSVAKELLAFSGIPQVRWSSARVDEIDEDLLDGLELNLGYPIYVKPANLGSSVGIGRAADRGQLREAIDRASGYDDFIVFEQAIHGREVEVAVLGNTDPVASLPGEIVSGAEFYDYEEKYLNSRASLLIPAPLDETQVRQVKELAIRAYRALRVEGMARVDFFLDADGRFLVNELNTIPGFTPISMYPMLWEASGVAPTELLDRLVDLAIHRHGRRVQHRLDR